MIKKFLSGVLHQFGIQANTYNRNLGRYEALYTKYKPYTMIPQSLFISNLELGEMMDGKDGDYVECGVWRGGMSAAFAETAPNRKVHLFDSFEGLPPAKEIDGKAALEWQANITADNYYDNCTADEKFARQAMNMAKADSFRIYKGWFDTTLKEFDGKTIAILRLDGDWYDSIMTCLDQLFPLVCEGGIVILDDYYTWDGCTKAVHDYLSKTKSASRINSWKGVAYIQKKS